MTGQPAFRTLSAYWKPKMNIAFFYIREDSLGYFSREMVRDSWWSFCGSGACNRRRVVTARTMVPRELWVCWSTQLDSKILLFLKGLWLTRTRKEAFTPPYCKSRSLIRCQLALLRTEPGASTDQRHLLWTSVLGYKAARSPSVYGSPCLQQGESFLHGHVPSTRGHLRCTCMERTPV